MLSCASTPSNNSQYCSSETTPETHPVKLKIAIKIRENSCGSKISFYAVTKEADEEVWQPLPTEDYIPTFTLDDIFNEQKLSKNYLTTETVLKDFELKTQFMLPQSGHDIIVIFTCLDELDKKEYQRIYKYLDGVMLDLIWKKGTFIKSDPYFPAY